MEWSNQPVYENTKGHQTGRNVTTLCVFNLFYQDMIDILNNMNCGISINDKIVCG